MMMMMMISPSSYTTLARLSVVVQCCVQRGEQLCVYD